MTVLVCFCTCPDADSAQRIADALVAERLAACVNVLPGLRSVYRWQGAIESATETVLIAKTTSAQAQGVVASIVSQHPYDLPAVIVLPVVGGAQGYLDWIGSEVSG